jgi:Lon protease-like protein
MKPSPTRILSAVPIFPLPDYYLFGGVVAPLQVFETRYRQMMSDLMDGPGRLVVAPYSPDGPRAEAGPELPAVGTLAEIVHHDELDDGRWVVVLAALDRVAITEVASDRLYRKVDAEILPEPEVTGEAGAALRERLVAAIKVRTEGDLGTPAAELPLGRLADMLLHQLSLDAERARHAYVEREPSLRAAMALAWHDTDLLSSSD